MHTFRNSENDQKKEMKYNLKKFMSTGSLLPDKTSDDNQI